MNLLSPNHDRWLVVALAALFFLFPLSKSLYVLPLLFVAALSFKYASPFQWWPLIRSRPLLWVPLALYALILLHSPGSPASTDEIFEHLRKYARLLIFVFLFLVFVGEEQRQRAALKGFTAAMVVIVGLTWFRIVWPNDLLGSQTDGSALFGDYITQNIMVAFFTLIAFHHARHSLKRWMRLTWSVVLVLSITSITHHSIGRTGLVLLLAVWLTYFAFVLRGWKLIMGTVALSLLAYSVYATSDHLQSRLNQALAEARHAEVDNLSSFGHRLYNYRTTPRMILDKPFFGHGTGSYHSQICRYLDRVEQCPVFQRHPHNQFLFLAAEHGLVGGGLYLALIVGLFLYAFKSRSSLSSRTNLLALAVLMLVDSMFNSPLFSSRESQFFTFMAGLFLAMNESVTTRHVGVDSERG